MSALRAEIDQALLKGLVGTVSWIAPKLTLGILRLLVRRRQQSALMLRRQRLPM